MQAGRYLGVSVPGCRCGRAGAVGSAADLCCPAWPSSQAPAGPPSTDLPVPHPKLPGRGRRSPGDIPVPGSASQMMEQILPTPKPVCSHRDCTDSSHLSLRGRRFLFTLKNTFLKADCLFSFSFHRLTFVICWYILCPGQTVTNSGTTPVWRFKCVHAKIFNKTLDSCSVYFYSLQKGLHHPQPGLNKHIFTHTCTLVKTHTHLIMHICSGL